MTPTDNIVIHDHNSSNGAQKDRVGGEIRREFVTARQEVPWAHGEPNGSRDETASPDILDVQLGASVQLGGRIRLTTKRGKRAVKSHPALIELAEMFVLVIQISGGRSRQDRYVPNLSET